MCKIKTKSNKINFSSSFASGHVKCNSEGPDYFLYWMSKLLVLKLLKKLKLMVYSKKKIFLRRLFISTRRLQYWHPCCKLPGEILEILFKKRKTISGMKSPEVKTSFLSCSSGNVDHFVTTMPEVSRSKYPNKKPKWKFSEKITSLKMLVWKGTRHFLQAIRENFGRNMTKFFAQFPKEKVS